MKLSQAFAELGYKLKSVRHDSSAEREDGICVSIWKRQLDWASLSQERSSATMAGEAQPAAVTARQILHASRALDEFGGWVDAILLSGNPQGACEDAQPWVPADHAGKRWRVTALNRETGEMRLAAQ